MERKILGELLDRYERSKAFREGDPSPARRIQLRVDTDRKLGALLEDPDRQQEFLRAAETLRRKNLIGYEWVRYEKGNLIERIWLITEEKSLQESYRICGRVGKDTQLVMLEKRILETMESVSSEVEDRNKDIPAFLQEMLSTVRESRSVPRYFFRGTDNRSSMEDADAKNRNLLRFLETLSGNHEEMLERVISTRLYGDSKYFEHELRSKVLSILRHIALQQEGEYPSEDGTGDRLLEERGIMKWPEILEFCGWIRLYLDNGQCIDFSAQAYGAYVNSDTIRHAVSIDMSGVTRILSIENKANYTWYISCQRKEDELVIYHGGVFSPVKGQWMKLISQAAVRNPGAIQYRHWSDIDVGGFRIFRRLQKEIFPKVEPEKMDLMTLRKHITKCIRIDDDKYIDLMKKMRTDPEYRVFHEVLDYMMGHRVRLEQEAEI